MNAVIEERDSSREPDEALEQSEEEATLPTEDGTEAAEEPAGEPTEEPSKPRSEKRISQLTARAHRAEERAEYWRDQALRAKNAPPPEIARPDPEPAPPKLADYGGDLAKFAEAQTKYVTDVRAYDRRQAEKAEAKRRLDEETRARESQMTERQRSQLAMLQKGQSKYADFDEVVYDPNLMISPEMLEIATDMENGPDVLYALGQKPDEAARIAGLTGRQAVLAMAQIQASVPRKRGSGAPPPPKPARGSGDTVTVDDEKLSADEAIRRDRERRAKLGRR